MDVKVHHQHTPHRHHIMMSSGGYPTPSRNMPSQAHAQATPDITLRDKAKLLQLADRIQTRKAPAPTPPSKAQGQVKSRTSPSQNPPLSHPRPPPSENRNAKASIENLSNPNMKRLGSVTPLKAQFSTPQAPPSSLKKSFTRSKLYSSFSPAKKVSPGVLKPDPAKTNIEHLVNYRKAEPSPAAGNNNNVFRTIHASFHDKTKLANAFSPRSQPRNQLNAEKQGVVGVIEPVNDNDEYNGDCDHFWNENEPTEGRLLTLPKISSATIIALNKKLSTGEGLAEPPVDGSWVPPGSTEPETRTSPTGKTRNSQNTRNSHSKACDPTGFYPPVPRHHNSNRGMANNSVGPMIPNSGNAGTDSLTRRSRESPPCGPSPHQPQHSSHNDSDRESGIRWANLPQSTRNLRNENEDDWPAEDEFDRKRSRSLPKSFLSMRNGLRSVMPSVWGRDELSFERFDRRPSGEVIPDDRRRKTLTPQSEFNPGAQLDAVKMRMQKGEGRPQSLDYSQRKTWMRVYRDMEVSSAVQSAVERDCSQPPEPSSARKKGVPAPQNKSNRSMTHPHLIESKEMGHQSTEFPIRVGIPASDSSVGSGSPKSSGSAGSSLFQRFSKTFSLRFGNAKEEKASASSRKKVKGRTAVGSSPDIFGRIDADSKRVIDPSSGKFRSKGPLLKSNREDKCQSGDSGIQMLDESPTRPFPATPLRPRRFQSEFPETESEASTTSSTSPTSMKKLSLVEIPNHTWNSQTPPKLSLSSTNPTRVSSEDLAEQKLQDDGFVSNDETEDDPDRDSPDRTTNPSKSGYYHSLPLKYSRQRKAAYLEQKTNSIRGKVVMEMVTTEQNYVKALNDIVQGFLHPCRARKDLFSEKVVVNIFSNVDELLRVHVKFLETLKAGICEEDWSRSRIGKVFTLWASKFDLYSDYCCHNPMSMATVRQLSLSPEYAEFFEACRRLQLMDKLPLHGFLLRPIQRICQYHLQLNELLKQTDPAHEDYQDVIEAVETMKTVAMNVNDTQRRFDALQEIVRLQASVIEGWEGEDLLCVNTLILQRGDLVKMTEGQKHKEVHVVVLNNEVLVCKKDSYKKGTLSFNCRIDLRESVWVNIDSNYEDDYFGMVHNSWRVYRPDKSAWILFTAASSAEKRKWTLALEQTCRKVLIDHRMIEMARITAIKLMLTESQLSAQSFSTSTLPKLKKGRKGSATITKLDSEAMLIEVGKLRKSSYNPGYQYHNGVSERSSKFYV